MKKFTTSTAPNRGCSAAPNKGCSATAAPFGVAAFVLFLAFSGCTGDLGINDFKGACEKDSDCGAGYRCDPQAGCVAAHADVGGGPRDIGPHTDGGHDARRGDGGDVEYVDGGDAGDGGFDTGPGDVGIFLRYFSAYDSAAGVCVSPSKDLIIKSSTAYYSS